VGSRAGLDTEDRGKILCPRRRSNLDRPVVQPVVRHYTALAKPNSFLKAELQFNLRRCDALGGPTVHTRVCVPASASTPLFRSSYMGSTPAGAHTHTHLQYKCCRIYSRGSSFITGNGSSKLSTVTMKTMEVDMKEIRRKFEEKCY
jgi:hypothetical protein